MKEQRILASSPLLICLAAAFSVCAVLPASADDLGAIYERAIKDMYEMQDSEAERARAMAKEGNYEEAINIMEKNVIGALQDDAKKIDSWTVRARLEEFNKDLALMKLEFGNLKLKFAREALDKGNYDDALSLANDAILITDQVREQAMELMTTARGRKSAAARKAAAATKNTDPELEQREARVKQLLAEAYSFYRNQKYDQAWRKVEDVYVLNPFNADAAYLASQIYKKFYQAGYKRRQADVQAQLSYEAWQWVEPAFPVSRDPGVGDDGVNPSESNIKEASDYKIQRKLDEIIFPMVSFTDGDLDFVVQTMRNNKHLDPEKEGVWISLIQPKRKAVVEKKDDLAVVPEDKSLDPMLEEDSAEEESAEEDWGTSAGDAGSTSSQKKEDSGIKVTLELRNVTLRQFLDYVCFLTDSTYVVRSNGVVFGAPDQRMVTKNYDIFTNVKEMVIGSRGSGEAAGGGEELLEEDPAGEDMGDEFGDEFGSDNTEKDGEKSEVSEEEAATSVPVVDDSLIDSNSLKLFFTKYGVKFPEKSSISYFRGKVRMNNTEENHRQMANILKGLNVEKPMIEVEVKSIELAESDMEELGFNWALETFGDTNGRREKDKRGWEVSKGGNTLVGGMLNMLDKSLSGVEGANLISGLNIFPDLFGSFKPFGIDESINLTLTINALDRSDRTEQVSAPRVLVADGMKATVKMTKAYYFPEDWEELEIEMEDNDNGDGPTSYSTNVTWPTPEFAESETPVGTEFTVTPSILEGNKTIRLDLNPKITAYTGKDEYDVGWTVWQAGRVEDKKNSGRAVVWRPVIATRNLVVSVHVNHGETLVIGGLSDSQSQKRLDKIPILADIPFIGRLFQSQSETSVRRNMLILVTARLVNNEGIPLPMINDLGNGGIPMLVR